MWYHENVIYWLWLMGLPSIGNGTARKLWKQFGDIRRIYGASPEELAGIRGINRKQRETLRTVKELAAAEGILERCRKLGIRILTAEMPDYPDRFREIPDISPVIYCKGQNRINEIRTIGIVGKRRCSGAGKQAAIDLAAENCHNGIGIISGFAKGIDSYAHTAAIKAGGYTVGVLGCGVDICYPPEQETLKEKMEEKGMLVSEYPPGTAPLKFNFPARNKLIAALSDELYVIEKGNISGTQSTIDAAVRYGKIVHLPETGDAMIDTNTIEEEQEDADLRKDF